MNEMYISPGVVDGAVVHKQAHMRLVDKYRATETTVHEHAHGKSCNDRCVVYQFPQMDCDECGGYGRIKIKKPVGSGLATKLVDQTCETCGGKGQIRNPDVEPGEVEEEANG